MIYIIFQNDRPLISYLSKELAEEDLAKKKMRQQLGNKEAKNFNQTDMSFYWMECLEIKDRKDYKIEEL